MGTRSVLAVLTGLLAAATPALAQDTIPDTTWTLAVAVQTDAQGELVPCHCPGNPTGGLSRRSGLLAQFRALPQGLVAVDGGDFAPGPGESLRVERVGLMVEAMALMKYGAVAVGERDLLLGRTLLAEAASRLPLVCANLRLPADLPPVPAVRWIDHQGRRVAITACLDPALYYEHAEAWADSGIALRDAWMAVDSVLAAVADSADLTVLLAHAPVDAVDAWLATHPPIDLVVVGHEPEVGYRRLETPPFVLETGPRSRSVGLAVLRGTQDTLRLERYRLYDLMETGGTDSRIDRLVDAFLATHGDR